MTIDHDALAAMVLRRRKVSAIGLLPDLPAACLDLYDEVKRLRADRDRFEAALGRACQVGGTTYLVERAEKAEAERERLLYVLDGVAGAIDTGRNEPLQVWRDQINIARAALKGDSDE